MNNSVDWLKKPFKSLPELEDVTFFLDTPSVEKLLTSVTNKLDSNYRST